MRNHQEKGVKKSTSKARKLSSEERLRKEVKYLREANKELIKQIWIARDEHNNYVLKVDGLTRERNELQQEINEKNEETTALLWCVIARFAAENPDESLCVTNDGVSLRLPPYNESR